MRAPPIAHAVARGAAVGARVCERPRHDGHVLGTPRFTASTRVIAGRGFWMLDTRDRPQTTTVASKRRRWRYAA